MADRKAIDRLVFGAWCAAVIALSIVGNYLAAGGANVQR